MPPWLVNESGFYKLVLKSRKPEARKFQDWATGVVLPAIRKDGGYILGEEKAATGEMGEDELLARALTVAGKKLERLEAEKVAALQRAEASESCAQVLAVRATGVLNPDLSFT